MRDLPRGRRLLLIVRAHRHPKPLLLRKVPEKGRLAGEAGVTQWR